RGGAAGVLRPAARSGPHAERRATRQSGGHFPPLRRRLHAPRGPGSPGTAAAVNDPALRGIKPALESPGESYAGRTRYTQLEYEALLANASIGIAFGRNRAIRRCNRFLEDMVGAGPGELVGESSAVLFATEEGWREAGLLAYSSTAPGETHDSEWKFKRRDGSVFHCRTRGRRIDAGGEEQEWIWSFEDVTAEREAEARVQQALDALERKVAERTAELEDARARAQHLAGHDALTGLPNRRVLEDRLSQALALSYRNRQQTAVMFIDLDRFKTINDSLGHGVGDALLK